MDNNHILFSPTDKMADVILKNYTLLSVLPRFDIKLGFGDKCIKDMCKLNNVDLDFFLLVCNTHTFSDYLPSKKQIRLLNIDSLINYLNRSHNYYINNRINDIKSKLTNLGQLCKSEHFHIINSFFEEYREEVIKHFQYEERVVFPYIVELVNGNTKDNFHIIRTEDINRGINHITL